MELRYLRNSQLCDIYAELNNVLNMLDTNLAEGTSECLGDWMVEYNELESFYDNHISDSENDHDTFYNKMFEDATNCQEQKDLIVQIANVIIPEMAHRLYQSN